MHPCGSPVIITILGGILYILLYTVRFIHDPVPKAVGSNRAPTFLLTLAVSTTKYYRSLSFLLYIIPILGSSAAFVVIVRVVVCVSVQLLLLFTLLFVLLIAMDGLKLCA